MNVIKKCREGLILFNANDNVIGKSLQNYSEFSQAEVDLFEKVIKLEQTIIDVGANIGTHTLSFARIVGKKGLVFAYEPQRLIYYSLCGNISLNNLTNVYCLQQAVGKETGQIEVPEINFLAENNFGNLSLINSCPENCNKCFVKLIKLDNLNQKVHFIKIDVEGMEQEVLLGAKELITKHRPFLYVENDRPEFISLLVKIIKSFDYEIYFHAPPLYNKNNYLNNERNVFGNTVSINMFCHPQEVPLEFLPEELKLTILQKDGKIILQKNNDCAEKVHDEITENVIKSCIEASIYYSQNLCDHLRALGFAEIVIRVKPEDHRGYYQSAMVLCKLCDYQKALELIDLSLERQVNYNSLLNKGTILGGLGKYIESISYYRKAIELRDDPNARFYLACALITNSEFEEGFEEYENRFKLDKVKQFTNLLPKIPTWNGTDSLVGKRILLYCEQGSGDTIMGVRYTSYLKDCHITVACPKSCIKLISSCEWVDEVIQFNADDSTELEGKYDYTYSVMSMPKLFGINGISNYLNPIKDKKFIFDKDYFNVGICWAGNDMHENDSYRSTHLKYFKKLCLSGVKLHSLQKGEMKRKFHVGEVDLLEDSTDIVLENLELEDFNDVANYMFGLDLVITVDTAIAHVAGAIGKSVWLLLGFYPDQRWLLDREDSIWYKSMKIFRQKDFGNDWNFVFENVRKELEKVILKDK